MSGPPEKAGVLLIGISRVINGHRMNGVTDEREMSEETDGSGITGVKDEIWGVG